MSTPNKIKGSGIGYKLKQTQHILRIYMDDALRVLGLTTPQYAVLSQLELKPGISNADLARASFVTPQTMHGIVSNLEKNNFLARKCDPQHGRIICTVLTKQGRKAVKNAHKLIHEVEETMTRGISKKNKLFLEKLLIECINGLEKKVEVNGAIPK